MQTTATMLPRVSPLVVLLIAGSIFLWAMVILNYFGTPPGEANDAAKLHFLGELDELSKRFDRIETLAKEEGKVLRGLRHQMDELHLVSKGKANDVKEPPLTGPWPDPIPVLVFVCNRANAIRAHLEHLIRLRPSAERFPIVVSQDCDNEEVRATVASFGDQVKYVKHQSGASANVNVPLHHKMYTTYYLIARHYKLGLQHVFETLGYTSVIITEDDIDMAPDFFEYFSATRKLLEVDTSLWCVQAWNDNGKKELIDHSHPGRLYRSDFFSGLGWMLSSTLWKELAPIWPSGFWDDWMRDPARRKDRVCVRPEISRTAMTTFGKAGASRGLFFDKHLKRVEASSQFVNFTKKDLRYLVKDKFDSYWNRSVYEDAVLMSAEDAAKELLTQARVGETPIRIEYSGNADYIKKADVLHVMHDFKAGVPRTAYQGVVSAAINGRRVYLAPDRTVIKGYDPSWHVPDGTPD